MKIILKIDGFTPDRNMWRKETFVRPSIEKLTKSEKTTSASQGENFATQLIEIKNVEPVYEFPKEGQKLNLYLKTVARTKLMGCLGQTRSFFDYTRTPSEGGTKGLKPAFQTAWNVKIVEIKDIGEIIPIGLTTRFKYKTGGMGTDHFDQLTTFTIIANINNPVLERIAKKIFEQAIAYLESTKLGRSGDITIV